MAQILIAIAALTTGGVLATATVFGVANTAGGPTGDGKSSQNTVLQYGTNK